MHGILPFAERLAQRALNRSGVASRFVETKLARLHVYDAKGRGGLPTIVLVHGLNSAATPFADMIHRLRPSARRVIVPDLPGHGYSDEPRERLTPETLFEATTELLDRELDEPAIVVGNSLGGAVALAYGLARPERVRGLFLVSPAGARMDRETLKRFLRTFDVKTAKEARVFMNRLYHRTPWFAPFVATDLAELFQRDAVRALLDSVDGEKLFTPEILAGLAVPVHLVWGRSERLLPPEHLAYFREYLPLHATIEEPEGFGHCPHFDDPAALAAKILAFARRI